MLMHGRDIKELTAELLVEHGRDGIKGCRCGWADIGRSHAKHVATVLDSYGLLATKHRDDDLRDEGAANALEQLVDKWPYMTRDMVSRLTVRKWLLVQAAAAVARRGGPR